MSPRANALAAPTIQSATGSRPVLQRQCACGTHTPSGGGECESCARKRLQRKAIGNDGDFEAPPIVQAVLRGAGRPLDAQARAALEPRFGRDFSAVRVHTDAHAGESARAVGALAYTVGRQIVFGAGQYRPGSRAGQRLLAHELTHTIQQSAFGTAVSPKLAVGASRGAAEAEADRVADLVTAGLAAPSVRAAPQPLLQRQADPGAESEPDFNSPQQRGGRPRAAFVDAGRRGDDQVRVAVTRYLCDCVGRSVTRTRVSTRIQPGPGVTLEICRGRVTGRITGDVVPSSFSTGRATVRGEVIVAPVAGGTGVRVGVEGEARNTGTEPQVGSRIDLRLRPPSGPQLGLGGEIFRGTESGQIDTAVTAGVEVNVPGLGPVRIGGGVTNPQDDRRGGQLTVGGNLPGQQVQDQICRECRCPAVYECLEDILPRDYEETVTYDVEDLGRLRYYYSLDTNQDTRDPVLRAESTRMIDEVARRVAAGARIVSVTGYASPEDNRERPTPNEQLSLSRGQRLRALLAARLGTSVQLPAPAGGGELFGRVATIAPGSRLADAILDTGFGDPEDVTAFLIGDDIGNPQLSSQFLALLERVPEPADRLRLFGVDSASPAAPRLLVAIEQFIRTRGRGPRPWENVFGYLRYATVELSTTHQESRQEDRRTSGSLTPMGDTICQPYARRAERDGKFGPAAPEPQSEAGCPSGEPHNLARFERKCDYR
jgi:hypothetical protein